MCLQNIPHEVSTISNFTVENVELLRSFLRVSCFTHCLYQLLRSRLNTTENQSHAWGSFLCNVYLGWAFSKGEYLCRSSIFCCGLKFILVKTKLKPFILICLATDKWNKSPKWDKATTGLLSSRATTGACGLGTQPLGRQKVLFGNVAVDLLIAILWLN